MKKKSAPKKKRDITRKEERKISEIEKEVKKAEKEIEEEKSGIREERISEFPAPMNVKAPVLERIASQQIMETPAERNMQEISEEKKIDYAASNEPKYSTGRIREEERKYETSFIPPVLAREESMGRRQEFLRPTERTTWEGHDRDSQFVEAGSIEQERLLPFEGEQKKYKKVRL